MKWFDITWDNKWFWLIYYRYKVGNEILDEWLRTDEDRRNYDAKRPFYSYAPDFDDRNVMQFPNAK